MLARVFLSIKERAGARNSSINEMPRNKQGGALASYFYNAMGEGVRSQPEPGNAAAPVARTKSSFLPTTPARLAAYDDHGNWIGPGPEPKKGRRRRPKKSGPKQHPPSNHGARKEIVAHMQKNLSIMKEHFKETEKIYEEHSAWPLTPIYHKIQECINKCKQEIRDTRTHTGQGRHKHNIEAVHAKRIDTTGWGFKAIYDAITGYVYQAKKNHLTLEKPHHHADGTHMYVNVVLAWLFAAKSQIMSNLTVFIDQAYNKTPAMLKFLEHEHTGREARAAYHKYKNELPRKKHGSYTLQDQTLLQEQHAAMYG